MPKRDIEFGTFWSREQRLNRSVKAPLIDFRQKAQKYLTKAPISPSRVSCILSSLMRNKNKYVNKYPVDNTSRSNDVKTTILLLVFSTKNAIKYFKGKKYIYPMEEEFSTL